MKASRARQSKPMTRAVQDYTASISYDKRLAEYDIEGSIAHAEMLGRQRIILATAANKIVAGLKQILKEMESGKFKFRSELEDIHLNIESRLGEIIGNDAGMLHTARSRNDQVALDVRMYCKDAVAEISAGITELHKVFVGQAEANITTYMPGFTHTQHAQPVLLAHHLLAYCQMLERDHQRLQQCLERIDVMPLGSGALAGLPYKLDREYVANRLGFSRVSQNSMDAVSDRDFIVELQAVCAILMMHLSRISEELVLWSSDEFGFVSLDDSYTTGSSIMPQKRNPDVAELARGRTGRVYGNLMAILTTLKGLPLSYNRDLQEDKEALFETVDILTSTLEVMAGMLESTTFNKKRMLEMSGRGYILATDVADHLTAKGMPFRQAHEIAGRLVAYATGKRKELSELTLAEYRQLSKSFESDVLKISIKSSIESRQTVGGTAPNQVMSQIKAAKQFQMRASAK
ncbi:MAG: argininosuccinate lyase [Dehalococcoidia bacterium]|nr:argininosuccinate lyase [Dehalococcoidia bacterium]